MDRTMTTLWLPAALLLLLGCGDDASPADGPDPTDNDFPSSENTSDDSEIPIDHCAEPVTTTDTDGTVVIVAQDALNYSFVSSLEVETVKVRSNSDLKFDWSGMTKDMLGHDFDPNTGVDMMELMLWRYGKEALLADINNDTMDTSYLLAIGAVFTGQNMTSGNFLDLQSPSGGDVDDAELLSYVDTTQYDTSENTYLVMVAEGESFGYGTKMISFFEPSPDVDNTVVRLSDSSTQLHYEANLTDLKRIAVPPNTSNILIDWVDTDKLMKNAMGRDWIPTMVTDVLVAHYRDESPADLQTSFLDLELIADETWRIFLSAGQSVNLSFLKNDAGESFPGIDAEGTWIIALKCGNCRNPAPWFLSILQSCPSI